jgi:hypothetical protein
LAQTNVSVFRKKAAFLDEVQEVSENFLRPRWDHRIVTRHQYEIAPETGFPQEHTEREARNGFLTQSQLHGQGRMPEDDRIGELDFLVGDERCN